MVTRWALGTLAVVVCTGLMAGHARAAVLTANALIGGDSTDGFNATGFIKIYAYNTAYNPTTSETIQSIPFASFDLSGSPPPSFSVTNFTGYDSWASGPAFVINSTDDTAMKEMLRTTWFPATTTGDAVLTIGGLQSNTAYRLDLFVYNFDTVAGRSEDFIMNDGTTAVFTAAQGVGYNVTGMVTSNGSNQIVVTLHGNASNPVLNGFAVFIVPEPGTLVLAALGLAGLGLVAWRRCRRRA